jgi:hypothetical protein
MGKWYEPTPPRLTGETEGGFGMINQEEINRLIKQERAKAIDELVEKAKHDKAIRFAGGVFYIEVEDLEAIAEEIKGK